jgi:hypothetical protein
MKFLPQPIRRLARESVTQPLSSPVASNASAYLEAVGEHKLGWRAFRRELVYRLSGQERYRIDRLCDGCRRGLWMYFGVPQIGDALMDLAPRSLFADARVEVDLVTDPHLADLFRADPWFAKVLPDLSAIGDATYDFVIVPSHKHRSLKMKQRHLPRHPWFSLHARFTGPEFHRGEFSARRIADFLGLAPAAKALAWHARQKLRCPDEQDVGLRLPGLAPGTIALALGGVDSRRSYSRWPEVVRALAMAGFSDLVLLGSENGMSAAREIARHGDLSSRTHDFVGKTSLSACQLLLSRCALAIAADGGLMHLAVAAGTPVVSLFQSNILPQWRLSAVDRGHAIVSPTPDVSDIAPLQIAQAAREALAARAAGA